MKILNLVISPLQILMQEVAKLVYQASKLILMGICGLQRTRMLEHGLNTNLSLVIRLARLVSKIEMMSKTRLLKSGSNLLIKLNKSSSL